MCRNIRALFNFEPRTRSKLLHCSSSVKSAGSPARRRRMERRSSAQSTKFRMLPASCWTRWRRRARREIAKPRR